MLVILAKKHYFLFMKNSIKKILTSLFLIGFLSSAFYGVTEQTEDAFDLFEQEEVIPCEQLIDVFEQYSDAVSLMESAFLNSLNNMDRFFEDVKTTKQVTKSQIIEKQNQIGKVEKSLSSNRLSNAVTKDNFLYSLSECLNK